MIEQPSGGLGAINDMWFQWVIDIGRPGPDRGLGGKYLVVGRGMRVHTAKAAISLRMQRPIRSSMPLRAFSEGRQRSEAHGREHQTEPEDLYLQTRQFRHALSPRRWKGKVRLESEPEIPETKFIKRKRDVLQHHPAQRLRLLRDRSTRMSRTSRRQAMTWSSPASSRRSGSCTAKKFKPDERKKKILTDAAAVGQAFGRSLQWRFADAHPEWAYYDGSNWMKHAVPRAERCSRPLHLLFEDGMFKPLTPTGARTSLPRGFLLCLHTTTRRV